MVADQTLFHEKTFSYSVWPSRFGWNGPFSVKSAEYPEQPGPPVNHSTSGSFSTDRCDSCNLWWSIHSIHDGMDLPIVNVVSLHSTHVSGVLLEVRLECYARQVVDAVSFLAGYFNIKIELSSEVVLG